MIAYVGSASDCTHGLAIALADESAFLSLSDAVTTCSGKTTVTGVAWRLPSVKDWQYMFIGCGSDESYSEPSDGMTRSYSGLASKLETAEGTALDDRSIAYWTSNEISPGSSAWAPSFNGSVATFRQYNEAYGSKLRACLAF